MTLVVMRSHDSHITTFLLERQCSVNDKSFCTTYPIGREGEKAKLTTVQRKKTKKKDEVQIKDERDLMRVKLAHAYAEVGMNKAHFVFSLHV